MSFQNLGEIMGIIFLFCMGMLTYLFFRKIKREHIRNILSKE